MIRCLLFTKIDLKCLLSKFLKVLHKKVYKNVFVFLLKIKTVFGKIKKYFFNKKVNSNFGILKLLEINLAIFKLLKCSQLLQFDFCMAFFKWFLWLSNLIHFLILHFNYQCILRQDIHFIVLSLSPKQLLNILNYFWQACWYQ